MGQCASRGTGVGRPRHRRRYEDGIAGVSRDEARLFLDRAAEGPLHSVRVWLNLSSVSEVDALYSDWQKAGVVIASAPEQRPFVGGFGELLSGVGGERVAVGKAAAAVEGAGRCFWAPDDPRS